MLGTYVRRLLIGAVAATIIGGLACEGPRKKPLGTGSAGASGTAGAAPGTAGAAPGTAGEALGTAGAAPGTAGEAPGTAGDPGTAGAASGTAGAASGTAGAASGTAGASGAAGDPGTAGAGTAGAAPVDNTATIPLPITVTSTWFPSGYYGDGYTMSLFSSTDPATRPITMAASLEGPCAARVAGPVGECWKVIYNPQIAEGGAPGFAGVAFLTDLAPMTPNWSMPLKAPRPAQGATMVTASVAGAAGGEAVDFKVGVQGDPAAGMQSVTLTKAWQTISIPLNGTYDHLLSGFGWGSTSATPITFYFDNVILK